MSGYPRPVDETAWVNAQLRELRRQLEEARRGGSTSVPPEFSWSPTLSGVTLGNGTVYAAYTMVGKLVAWELRLTCGSTTTVSDPAFTMPVPPAQTAAYQWRGDMTILDVSEGAAGRFTGNVVQFGSGTMRAMYSLTSTGATRLSAVTNSAPIAAGFAVGDQILCNGVYIA